MRRRRRTATARRSTTRRSSTRRTTARGQVRALASLQAHAHTHPPHEHTCCTESEEDDGDFWEEPEDPDEAPEWLKHTKSRIPSRKTALEMLRSMPDGPFKEALTAVNVAALTVYDMVKAVDKAMEIGGIRVILKDGGKSGRYQAE